MKFGVREICDIVLRAKSAVEIGTQSFGKDEPVIYFDSSKTSTVEGASTTVYANGGRGNSRLIAWEGERTVTFTMEDSLMSPLGFAILSGAGVTDAAIDAKINVHQTATVGALVGTGATSIEVDIAEAIPANGALSLTTAYAFIVEEGEIKHRLTKMTPVSADALAKKLTFAIPASVTLTAGTAVTVLVDFYVEMASGAQEITITPDKFAGYYYLEAATLFRRQSDGVDLPAQFIIPKVKIQSAFKFQMASSGDPSTFTFTMDAFPDYLKFDKTKKVLFALQIVG